MVWFIHAFLYSNHEITRLRITNNCLSPSVYPCVDVRIQQTDNIKHLGVIIDNKLSWKPQISLYGKLSQACGVVCKIRHFADMKILRLIYFSLFHSHLQYCIIDWGRAYKTVIRPAQVLQNQIVKYKTFSNRTSSASNILKLLKILKVSDLHQLDLEKFVYKYNDDILPSSFDNVFSKLYKWWK